MTATPYPLADRSTFHYSPPSGWVLIWLRPSTFIRLAPSMGGGYDPDRDPYIKVLEQHIRDGHPLDGLELSARHHDGRHRAYAARAAGCEKVPVYCPENHVEFFQEQDERRGEFAQQLNERRGLTNA